ncbi:DUF5050 domain-containing protein [Clostridium autoethanogenum]|uniref:DUF5050 domain-containing protein n=1 Tax=Clostridium autoethanogenum DSM 10061 TaxID=1341692 RepID=A0ABN4BHZ3_9CLOT|nr:DUF5050 domain-containing protein [Clostridium autoethanogenum]AGY77300.1 DUF5050 domain-containing protein [Clostridium autoethanogenum DSM 10061]ALU37442.1 Ig domain-containing protein [Clostridium autoethanogenum DSM 10061]OVY49089.1 Bacterial Ig-like domain (group 4) [Clostridium autoethanogenum]
MKKTRLLVMTAAIVLGIGTSVYAKLPPNSIVVGNNVYDISYFTNDASGTNTAKVNDQLANNLGKLYYVDSTGVAKDIFTEATVDDSQIVSKVGNTLTYYPGNGTTEKIVTDANNNFLDPNTITGGYVIAHITYKQLLSEGLNLFTCQLSQLSGVSGAAYFQVGSSPMTPLTDVATYMGQLSNGAGNMVHLYASDGATELANGYLNIVTNGASSGDKNLTVNLTLTGNSTDVDSSTQGNKAYNIVNNGFVTIDKSGKWIYYSNTGDSGKLYKRSATGTDDMLISNDSAKYINVVGDWVYYSNYNDGGKIYKVKIDGTQRQKISDDMASCVSVVGDSIYYINHSDNDRIYVQDSTGKKMVLSDQAKYLSVTGNFLFYVNAGDSNTLYSYDLRNSRKAKISTINTKFINACNDYLVFYTGYDGVLYRSTNAQGQIPVPMSVTTNVQTSAKASSYKALTDKPTIICATDDNNIYYISYVDGNKIYKLDNTGNGYRVVNDSADYINIINDSLYYMKSGKISVAPKDGDGTQRGVSITKPRLNSRVVSVKPMQTYTTDDITKFNFPETVSCIMSDGSEQTLVVSWDKTIPKASKGIYTFKGTILGYGTSVTMNVALDSGTINANNVTIVNNVGSKDTISITGLTTGDVVNVYNSSTDTKPLKSAVVDASGKVNMTGLNLSPDGGSVYISLTKTGRQEGNKVGVQYQAEAPAGFTVDAANQNITGLQSNKLYKVYIQDENADGTVPVLPTSYDISAQADGNGVLKVPTMISKIDGNKDGKQMLRVVAAGNVDSAPSSPIEIKRATVPNYVDINLSLGRISGTDTGMVFTYDDLKTNSNPTWYPCQSGSTSISMTRSLQVSVKELGSGPVLESKPVSYGLFQKPVINGITDGGTYTTKQDKSTGESLFPTVTWNDDSIIDADNSTKYCAVLTKDGNPISGHGSKTYSMNAGVVDTTGTTYTSIKDGSDLESVINSNGDGSYALTVVGTKTVSGMNPSSATNVTTVKFTVNSAVPATVDIRFAETAGTEKWNDPIDHTKGISAVTPADIPTLYQATPNWTDLAGTIDTAVIQRLDTAPADDSSWNLAAKVAFQRTVISQDGYYKLTVTSTSTENGATNVSTKVFRVDTQDKATSPSVVGVSDGGIYDTVINGITITDTLANTTKATIMRDGYKTDYIVDPTSHKGGSLTVNGNYVLTLDTTNNINGATTEKTISFKIDDAESNPTQPAPAAPTNIGFTFNNDGTVQFTGVDTSEEYSVNNGQSWTPVTSQGIQLITSTNDLNLLSKATTTNVEVRYRANGSTPASEPQVISLAPSPAAPSAKFEFSYDANHNLIGELKNSDGTAISNPPSYEYSIDGGLNWNSVDNNGAFKSEDVNTINTTNGVQVRTKASGQTKASNVEKISVTQAAAPNVTSTQVTGGVKLTSLSTGLEYRVNVGSTKGTTWNDFTSGSIIPVTQSGSIDVRSKATGTAMPGNIANIPVQLSAAPAIKTAAVAPKLNDNYSTAVTGKNLEINTKVIALTNTLQLNGSTTAITLLQLENALQKDIDNSIGSGVIKVGDDGTGKLTITTVATGASAKIDLTGTSTGAGSISTELGFTDMSTVTGAN